MISRIINICARHPWITCLFILMASVWGYWSLKNAPLDAIPDLSDVQVIVFTEWPGRSPDLVEDQITYPLVTTLRAAPRVTAVRGQTFFGFSFVNVVFEEGTDIYWARSRVLEYLNSVKGRLPTDVSPILGPDATGVGWVFEYALVDLTGKQNLQDLRSLQDWTIRYALQSVPGVAEVASVGGFVKQYQIQVDPNRLAAYKISLTQVIDAVRNSNSDVGGRELEIAGTEYLVRGRGYVKSVKDLENVVVSATPDGTPIFIKELGEVHLGPDMRRGAAELDGQGETVGGIIVMRYGQNALRVIDDVKQRIEEIKPTLPEGVDFVVTYDRSGLIKASISTLTHTIIEEMIVVSLVIFLFLFAFRSSFVAIITIPLAVLIAFIPMYYQGLTANIMSLGGIIVAIGAMVDAFIIMIENIHKKLEKKTDTEPYLDTIIAAMQEVGPSLFFSLLVITVSFISIFALEGPEGRLFKPLAFTKTYSMGFAALLAITLTPALAAIFIRKATREEKNPLNRWLIAAYTPFVRLALWIPKLMILFAVIIMAITIPFFLKIGSEFMPPLNEGVILFMPTGSPAMSIDSSVDILYRMDNILKQIPEVDHVFGKTGRSETATDPAPIEMIETIITLKPKETWRSGLTWDSLIQEMDEKLQVAGMAKIWWMPIQTRTEMLATGIRSTLGIKVLGSDIAEIERLAIEVEGVLSQVKGTRSVLAERLTSGNFIDFDIRREEAARYGLTVGDVEKVIEIGIGGMNISTTIEGRERYPINVRYAQDFRSDPDSLERVLIATSNGSQIPISQVSAIRFKTGPTMIRDEDGRLVGYVFVDVDPNIPISNYVEQAKKAVADQVKVPAGYRLEWSGQYKYLEHALERLKLVLPLTLFLVILLLYFNTQSLIETAIIMLTIPFSLVGAVWILYLLDYNLSIAVWVGVIALAGLDAEIGVIMLLYLKLSYNRWKQEGKLNSSTNLNQAIIEGSAQRIRPTLMTVLTIMVGLLPVLWSTGAGSDVMKRIAAPMVGGLITSFILLMFVYPAIFLLWKRKELNLKEDL